MKLSGKGSTMTIGVINVLVVDKEPYVCRLIKNVLISDQFHCTSVHSGKEAKYLLLKNKFDVIILDLLIPDVSGMDLLNFISSRGLPTQAICITSVPSIQSAREGVGGRSIRLLRKTF